MSTLNLAERSALSELYTAITLYEATCLSAANSAFTNNGTVNTGTATNLNTFAAVTTSATSVIAPGGTSGVGNSDIANASTVALNGTLKLDIQSIASSTSYDKITNSAAGGGFDISNATLDLTGIFTPVGNRTISILTTNATGTLIGEFSSVIGLGTGWSLNYTTGIAGKVQLVYSTPTTWTGTTSTDWATGTNWTGAGVPNSLTDVTIANVTNQPIIASNVSVASLTLNASTSLTVNTGFNLTVAGAVANNGTITVENNANLIQTALTNTNSGSGTATIKRNSASIQLYDYTLWSSPVAGQKLKAFSPNTLDTRFYTYNSGTNLYNVVTTPLTTTNFATATGYLIRADNTLTAATPTTFNGVFTGVPNNGTVPIALNYTDAARSYNLVGNPYPSAIDLELFLLDPANAALINGQAYFWEQVTVNSHTLNQYQGGYGVYTPGTSIYTPAAFWTYDGAGNQTGGIPFGTGNSFERRFAPVGQGFIVYGTASGNVTMKNAFRVFVKEGVVSQSQFARTNENSLSDVYNTDSEFFPEIPNVAGIDYTQIKKGTAPYIRIHAMYNNGGVRPTTIAFLDTATDGFDYGSDGRSPSSEAAEFYYVLTDMPHEYVATAVQFNIDKRIPVGFRCTSATNFKVQVKDVVDFDANQEVYLHDKQSDVYYDIKIKTFILM